MGFCSFGSRYLQGYRRSYDIQGNIRDETKGVINNIKKQAPNLAGISFSCLDYVFIKPCNLSQRTLFYCDPPYKDTKEYSGTKRFNYEEFYSWCKDMTNAGHIVLVSEYSMPEGFTCIWQKEIKCMVDKNGSNRTERIEKLWLL